MIGKKRILVFLVFIDICIKTQTYPTNNTGILKESSNEISESERHIKISDETAIESVKYIVNDSDTPEDTNNQFTGEPTVKTKKNINSMLQSNYTSNSSSKFLKTFDDLLSFNIKYNVPSSFETDDTSYESTEEKSTNSQSAEHERNENNEGHLAKIDHDKEIRKSISGMKLSNSSIQISKSNDATILDDDSFQRMLPTLNTKKVKSMENTIVISNSNSTSSNVDQRTGDTSIERNLYKLLSSPTNFGSLRSAAPKSFRDYDDDDKVPLMPMDTRKTLDSELIHATLNKLSEATNHPLEPVLKRVHHLQSYPLPPIYSKPKFVTRQMSNPTVTYHRRLNPLLNIPQRNKYVFRYWN